MPDAGRRETDTPVLLSEPGDGVLLLTLNRPRVLNAMTPVMRARLHEAIDEAERRDDVRVVVVTGAGRGYCSGADMSPGPAAFVPGQSGQPFRDGGGDLARRFFTCTKPVIGAVNGVAAGIGAAMLLPMDYRIAAASARFGFVYTRRGISPEGCSSWFLPRVVGINRAADWMLTGRLVDAEEALTAGLASSVVPDEQLMDAALETAALITRNTAAAATSVTRQMLWGLLAADSPDAAHEVESRMIPLLSSRPDAAEGVRAFVEKRAPVFSDAPVTEAGGRFPWEPRGTSAGRDRELPIDEPG